MTLERTGGQACLSDLRLEEWSHAELDSEAQGDVESHLAGCERCRARSAALQREGEAFARVAPKFEELLGEELVPASAPAETSGSRARCEENRSIAPNSRRRSWGWAALASGLAAAAMLTLFARGSGEEGRRALQIPASPQINDGTRVKGGVRLMFHVRRGGAVMLGQPDQVVHPGDVLRFSASATAPAYVSVLSVDGAGVVSVYHPQQGQPEPIEPGSAQALSSAIELDDTLGQERLYGVFCHVPIDSSRLREALERATGSPRFPSGCQVDPLVIRKELP